MKTIGYLILIILLLTACGIFNEAIERDNRNKTDKSFQKVSYKKNTVNTNINRIFYEHCKDCEIISFKSKYDNRKNYIPSKLDHTLVFDSLDDKEAFSLNINYKHLLLAGFSNSLTCPELLVNTEDMEYFNISPFDYTAKYVYSRTCAGYLNSMLEMGIKIPVGSVKTALRNEEFNNSVIMLIKGVFESPLSKILNNHDFKSNYIYFNLYNYYKDLDNQNNTPYYIFRFEGVCMNRSNIYKAKSNSGFNISLNYAGSISPISVIDGKYSGDASFFNTEYFEGSFPQTLIVKDQTGSNSSLYKLEKKKLPNFEDVKNRLENIIPESTSDSNLFIKTNSTIPYYIFIPGVPSCACNKDSWKILDEKNKDKSVPVPFSIQPLRTKYNFGCVFKFNIQSDNESNNSNLLLKNYILKFDDSIEIKHQTNLSYIVSENDRIAIKEGSFIWEKQDTTTDVYNLNLKVVFDNKRGKICRVQKAEIIVNNATYDMVFTNNEIKKGIADFECSQTIPKFNNSMIQFRIAIKLEYNNSFILNGYAKLDNQ